MASSSIIQQMKHIWVIAGPAGCGKSTVAIHLARELNLPFLEGDDVRLTLAMAINRD